MHYILPSIGIALSAYGFGAISDMTFTLIIDSFPNVSKLPHAARRGADNSQLVAQTFVTISFFRNALSIAGPFSITSWMEVMSISSISIVAAAISLGIHLLGIPVAIWGKNIRTSLATRYHHLSDKST